MCNYKQQFQDLKNKYTNNMNECKNLIVQMQKNLKKRTPNNTVKCLDGKEYQIDSNNVEELYAIDGALSAKESSETMTQVGNNICRQMERYNKYTPSHPYPEE